MKKLFLFAIGAISTIYAVLMLSIPWMIVDATRKSEGFAKVVQYDLVKSYNSSAKDRGNILLFQMEKVEPWIGYVRGEITIGFYVKQKTIFEKWAGDMEIYASRSHKKLWRVDKAIY